MENVNNLLEVSTDNEEVLREVLEEIVKNAKNKWKTVDYAILEYYTNATKEKQVFSLWELELMRLYIDSWEIVKPILLAIKKMEKESKESQTKEAKKQTAEVLEA